MDLWGNITNWLSRPISQFVTTQVEPRLERFREIKETPTWKRWMGEQPDFRSPAELSPLKQFWDSSRYYYEKVMPYIAAYGAEMPDFKGENPQERLQSAREFYSNPEEVRKHWESITPKWQREGQMIALDPLIAFGGTAGKMEQGALLARNALRKGIPEAKVISELTSRFKFNPEEITQVLNKAKGITVKAAEAIPKAGAEAGKIPPVKPPVAAEKAVSPAGEGAIAKLLRLVKSAEPVREVQEAMYSAERGKRAIAGAERLAAGEGKEAFATAVKELGGELPKPKFTPPEVGMTSNDITELYNVVRNATLRPDNPVKNFYAQVNTAEGLTKLLSGNTPTESELRLLEKTFGPELVKEIMKHKSLGKKVWENFLDIANLPRAVQTAWDFSAPFRQGAILFAGHPIKGFKAMTPMFKAFFKEKYYNALNESIMSNKWAPKLVEDWGLDITTIAPTAKATAREEPYISRFARYIPGIRQSERAYLGFLNKMRMDIAASVLDKWEKAGIPITENLGSAWANAVNVMSGRGSLGKLTNSAPFLNTLLYSPRLQAARVQLPYKYFQSISNPKLRPIAREMTRNIVSFLGAGATIGGLAALAGAKVELDPRSTDFLKVKVGDTRIDQWAGFQQYARFLAQLVTSQRKTTSAGALIPVNRYDLVLRFLESKMSPSAGMVRDALTGKSFMGDELDLSWKSLGTQAKERMLSLFVQDMWDAAEQEGLAGVGLALPAMFGVGVQTYPDTLHDLEVQLGQTNEEGKVYTLSNFSGDMSRRGYIKGGITEGSDLVRFRASCEELFDKYNEVSTTGSSREIYRQQNPKVDAALFFWGRTQTLRTDEAKRIVQEWMSKYEIPNSALPEWGTYQQTIEPTKEQINRQQSLARSNIEAQIWAQYPPQLRMISDEIIRLENSGNRNDALKARQMLMQNPQILMARRLIAQQWALYKRQQLLQAR